MDETNNPPAVQSSVEKLNLRPFKFFAFGVLSVYFTPQHTSKRSVFHGLLFGFIHLLCV